jgi:hypothetical protein
VSTEAQASRDVFSLFIGVFLLGSDLEVNVWLASATLWAREGTRRTRRRKKSFSKNLLKTNDATEAALKKNEPVIFCAFSNHF